MYKVMLVDDDYPVVELLSEVIPWKDLGFQLMGAHENGLQAWEHIQLELPDVLITDIGMPKMNGLELVSRLKERKANARVAILSCHSEFQYAQQAMRLNVQDYLIKDALDPKDLEELLRSFRESLNDERLALWQRSRLRQLVDDTMELRKEQWLKNFIHQPLLSPEEWQKEARTYGLFIEGDHCLTVIGFLEGFKQAKQRFFSDETLRFAVNNVVEEVLQSFAPKVVYFGFGAKESLFLFSYRPGIKTNIYDEVLGCLKAIQAAMDKVLKLRMSFIIGESCSAPEQLKIKLKELLASGTQRFYMREGSIVKKCIAPKPQQDLFAYYDQANSELREVLMGKRQEAVAAVVERWIELIREQEFAPEVVKDWMLKLLLDQKLKWQSLQFIRPNYSTDTLHKEIVDLDALSELQRWLTDHLQAVISLTRASVGSGMRKEIMEACKYVSLHLDRKISLEEVADHFYLNPSYFSRLFKKEVGESFIEYVTRIKMERAKELLDQTGHSVGKICEMLGYDNQSYFIKTFKSHAGVTPVEYRG